MAKQESWNREAGYIWALIGSAVGFANILSFSALCYKNGGGAFLIPYLVAHLVVGIPMLILEAVIGQRTQMPLAAAGGASGGFAGRFFGWLAVLTCATIGGFYTVLTGFSVAYTYFAAKGSIPIDTAHFFKNEFLNDSGSLTMWGGVAPSVFLATLAVVVITWFVLSKKIQSGVEKVCTIFMPLLGIMMLLFATVACFLPGAGSGFQRYLVPDFSRLSDFALWRDVFGQVFFSLSLGLGIIVGYSRYNPTSFNIKRAMVQVALGDVIISVISGFAIFGGIGYMSFKSGMAFDTLVKSDSAFEIGFVIFPMILSTFGPIFSKIIGALFFFCVFIAGITGVFSIIESVAGNIEIEFQKTRKKAVGVAMVITTLLATFFCFGNGQHLLGAIAPMVLGNAMLVGGAVEIVLFLFFSKVIRTQGIWFNDRKKSFPFLALKYVVLPLLVVSLFMSIYKEMATGSIDEAFIVRWGWLIASALIASVLSIAGKRARAFIVD